MSTSVLTTSNTETPLIGVSVGEPAGIGPDLAVLMTQSPPKGARLVYCVDRNLLVDRAKIHQISGQLPEFNPECPDKTHSPISVWHHPLNVPVTPGQLNPANSTYVLQCLDDAANFTYKGIFHALVTGPVQKSIIEKAGIPFSGHTEYLAQKFNVSKVVMLLVGGGLRVALATTHIPISQVAAAITEESLFETIQIIYNELKNKFGLSNPLIKVAGLNPHAGENGHLGTEEINMIRPAIERCQTLGQNIQGPFSADTLFLPESLRNVECVLVMYHDQGLPVLKTNSFGKGVNITLGLPIIRTSVDHGTALDLAGKKEALIDKGSLIEAIETALLLKAHS